MHALPLSIRLLNRQARSGSLLLLAAGLVLATAALVAVGLFTDRVGRALERSAGEALAADIAIASRAPLPAEFRERAESLGLAATELSTTNSVVFAGGASQLADIKAVNPGYPLRGRLRVAASINAAEQPVDSIPEPGTAWLEPRALRSLDIGVGDAIELGVLELIVTRVLAYEPDRADTGFQLAPRVLIHGADLEASELLGPGARVRHRLLVAGDVRAVEEFRQWARPRLDDRQRLLTVADQQQQTGAALEQARRFLGMAALTAVILSAVAVLLASLRFARAERDTVALLKAFGAGGNQVFAAVSLMLLWLALIAAALGALIGLGGQAVIAAVLAEGMPADLPPPRAGPVLAGAGFTLLLAAGFALPPLASLRKVPPMRILNRALDTGLTVGRLAWILPVAAALAIPVLQLGEFRLAAIVLGASAVLAGILALTAWGTMHAGRALSRRARGAWRFGLAGLNRRRSAGIIQTTALGLGLMALLLLVIVRGELLGQWRASLPPDTPDHFAVNIQPEQRQAVAGTLQAMGAARLQIRPMATARLVEVSGAEPPEDAFTGQVNVSWIDALPPANRIAQGAFWSPGDTGQVSLAARWAERTGVGLGDEMTFESGARRFTATVTSIREVDWGSFNANFFILLTPEAGEALPHQYIASFYLPDGGGLREFHREFPNVSVLDVGAILARVGEIIEQVSRAAQVVFAFTLAAGLIVLLAALEATRDQRRTESALIRTLGADNTTVRAGLLIEYGAMAVIAGALATAGAAITGWLLARELFEFAYRPSPLLFAAGFAGSLVLVVGAGWLGNRSVLTTPPVRVLRADS